MTKEGMKIYTANRETGVFIEEFATVEGAKRAIAGYESDDKKEGIYEPNFYDVVNEEHETII